MTYIHTLSLQTVRITELTDLVYYEYKKHDGSLPIVGVNTYLKEDSQDLGPVESTMNARAGVRVEGEIRRFEVS